MSCNTFYTPANQNSDQNKKDIEDLIGKEQLDGLLDDIVGSSQCLVEDQYSFTNRHDPNDPDDRRIKYVYAGDPTSDACVVWVDNPSSDDAYAVKINFEFIKCVRCKPMQKRLRSGKDY